MALYQVVGAGIATLLLLLQGFAFVKTIRELNLHTKPALEYMTETFYQNNPLDDNSLDRSCLIRNDPGNGYVFSVLRYCVTRR